LNFFTINSGSNGNGYVLVSDTGETLCIEAGVKFKEVKKILNFDISNAKYLIATHLHTDHFKFAKEYAMSGVDVYSSIETLTNSGFLNDFPHRAKPLEVNKKVKMGSFTVMGFDLIHDVRNYGYLIHHKEMGLAVMITDTHYCPFMFPGLNNILLECNYSDNVLDRNLETSKINPALANRIRKSHMSEDTMIGFLKANDTTQVNNIVIIHLSNGNSDAEQIVRRVTETTGIVPHIAKPGLKIEFNKTAF